MSRPTSDILNPFSCHKHWRFKWGHLLSHYVFKEKVKNLHKKRNRSLTTNAWLTENFNVNRERDELMDQVTSLKNRVHEMSHREEEAYQQMKKGIELVEQAQLEQTQVKIYLQCIDFICLFHYLWNIYK